MRSRVPAEVSKELRRYAEPGRAESSRRFFQTGRGQYGEADRFLGIRVPHIRKVVKKFRGLPPNTTMELLASPWHEERLFALLMLVDTFRDGGADTRNSVYRLYMENTRWVNNWDLVDLSAPHVPGAWLFEKDREPLYRFAAATDLWKRRISIVATLHFIREYDFEDTLGISGVLLHDEHHLIHKAVGWMLREVGKRDPDTEEDFLRKHCLEMPRTMLRYAIEKFPEQKRQMYLKGDVR
ncbi:MAG: DNA alkylation repair protein [Candidatus Aegiribacteria sp.]